MYIRTMCVSISVVTFNDAIEKKKSFLSSLTFASPTRECNIAKRSTTTSTLCFVDFLFFFESYNVRACNRQ